jgi:hypothetical protein
MDEHVCHIAHFAKIFENLIEVLAINPLAFFFQGFKVHFYKIGTSALW